MVGSIQYLRGFAALSVVLCHLYPMFLDGSGGPLSSGAAGVDVFFVISGFIMWHVVQNREPEPANFLLHRLIRVAPMYWLVTLLLAAAAILKPNFFPLDHPTIPHVLMSIAFVPYATDASAELKPILSQGWTLYYEVFFYLIFSAVLFLSRQFRLIALSITLLALSTAGFFLDMSSPLTILATNSLLIEFLGGILIAVAFSKKFFIPVFISWVLISISIFLIVTKLIDVPYRLIFFGIPAILIVWSMVSLEANKGFGNSSPLLSLGDASYSIYLIHFLVAVLYLIVAPHVGLPSHGISAFSLAVAFAVFVGFVLNIFIERPLLTMLRSAASARFSPQSTKDASWQPAKGAINR